MRCGTFGTSGHVTAKSSIFPWGVLYKSGVYARNVLCLTPGDLSRALGFCVQRKLAEGEVIPPDREKEVCKGHSRRETAEGPNGFPRGD